MRALVGACLLLAAVPCDAEIVAFSKLPVGEAVSLVLGRVLHVPFVISPAVSLDRRPVSARINGDPRNRGPVLAFLRSVGVKLELSSGVWVAAPLHDPLAASYGTVERVPGASGDDPTVVRQRVAAASGEALDAAALGPVDQYLYSPQFRDASYLAGVASALLPSVKFAKSHEDTSGSRTSSAAAPTVVAFSATFDAAAHVYALMHRLDVAEASVRVRVALFEFSESKRRGSAVEAAATLLGRSIATINGNSPPADLGITVAGPGFSASVSIIRGDGRFTAVSSPDIIVRSGAEGTLTSGSQVPILGALSVGNGNAAPVQSIQYRDVGLTLRVRPVVMGGVIDVDLQQELSSFVQNRSSGIDSPVLNRRSAVNRFNAQPGAVYILGGLSETTDTKSTAGLFHGLLGSRLAEHTAADFVLLMSVELLDAPRSAALASTGRDQQFQPTEADCLPPACMTGNHAQSVPNLVREPVLDTGLEAAVAFARQHMAAVPGTIRRPIIGRPVAK